MAKVEKIIEALGRHEDPESINVLKNVGTNSSYDFIRENTIKALIRKNTHDSLKLAVMFEGKGINDLSPIVSETAIEEILALKDKEEVMRILDDTAKLHSNEKIRKNANSVKALIALSN